LETTETNTLRKIFGKTKSDHVRNQDVMEQSGTKPIGEWVNKRREKWNYHISRKTGDRTVRVVRRNSSKDKRRSGRTRTGWSNSYST
jgi:hypothetical protein